MANKLFIVLSSPSGGGKSTVAKHLMTMHSEIKFSERLLGKIIIS